MPRRGPASSGQVLALTLRRTSADMKVILRRHPLALYFALAFGISWGGVAVATVLFEPTLLTLFVPIAAGPSGAALIVTGVVRGKDGYRSLFRRITVWRRSNISQF